MARKKPRNVSKRERRRIRLQQVFFVMIAVLVVASFVISLFARP
jgi:predicted nucleic acid-binding Zn ribbon protein